MRKNLAYGQFYVLVISLAKKRKERDMSADNGIYILESEDGFRVIHAQSIDNLHWWWTDERLYDDAWVKAEQKKGNKNPYEGKGKSRDELNPRELIDYFGDCEVFKTKEEAFIEACKIYDEIMASDFPVIEYGIQFVSGWEDKEFPEQMSGAGKKTN